MNPDLTPLALLWALASGHPDAGMLKRYADMAHVPTHIWLAVVAVESGRTPNNNARGKHNELGRAQLKRVHESAFRKQCGPKTLADYTTNVCVGAHLLRRHYNATGSWAAAIRRYNGSGPATDAYMLKVERELGRMTLKLLELEVSL